jgi:hypothetical protein
MQILRILSFYLDICVYTFKYLQILHIGVIAMKQNNRQTSPFGRLTEEKQAGLSLPQPSLFTVDGNAYKYYNESAKNISKFIARLTQKKFSKCPLLRFPNQRKIIVNTHSSFKRLFDRPLFSNYKFSY